MINYVIYCYSFSNIYITLDRIFRDLPEMLTSFRYLNKIRKQVRERTRERSFQGKGAASVNALEWKQTCV